MKKLATTILLFGFIFLSCTNINKQNDELKTGDGQETIKYKQLNGWAWNNINLWFDLQQQQYLRKDKRNVAITKEYYLRGFLDAIFFSRNKSIAFYISAWWNTNMNRDTIKATDDFYKDSNNRDIAVAKFLSEILPNNTTNKLQLSEKQSEKFEYKLADGNTWKQNITDPLLQGTILKRSAYIKGLIDTLIINMPSASYLKDIEHNKILQMTADFYLKWENRDIPIALFITQILPDIINNKDIKATGQHYINPIIIWKGKP